MYQCQVCLTQQLPGVKAHRVPIKLREVVYPFRRDANKNQQLEARNDSGGRGWQIVEERTLCGLCVEDFNVLV